MNLKEFVQTALVEIIHAVASAQEAAEEAGASVNPKVGGYGGASTKIQEVDFDVSVTAVEGAESGARLQVGAFGVGGSVGGGSDRSTASENRVKFTVLVQLPTQD